MTGTGPLRVLIGLAMSIVLLGCAEEERHGEPTAESEAAKETVRSDNKTPGEVVSQFLDAVRHGDDATAESMLTAKALEETAKRDMVVAPPGSSTATFEVGEVEEIAEGAAHVVCKWTEVIEGETTEDTIIWALRKGPAGWRIAGMIIRPFADRPPVPYDFEDPADMEAKERYVRQEMARRMGLGPQGNQPGTPQAGGNVATTNPGNGQGFVGQGSNQPQNFNTAGQNFQNPGQNFNNPGQNFNNGGGTQPPRQATNPNPATNRLPPR